MSTNTKPRQRGLIDVLVIWGILAFGTFVMMTDSARAPLSMLSGLVANFN